MSGTLTKVFNEFPSDQQHALWQVLAQQPLKDFLLGAIKVTEHMQNTMLMPETEDHIKLIDFQRVYNRHRRDIDLFRELLDIDIAYQKHMRAQSDGG